jgi:hypothetical protein
MTAVDEGMRTRIRSALHAHAASATTRVSGIVAKAEQRCLLASRYVELTAQEVADAESALDVLQEQAAEQQAEDAGNLAVVRSVRAVHDEENEACVRRLLCRAAASVGDERAWLFLAALRGVHDLNRMFP